MTVKEIRNRTGMSQQVFAEKYGIPKRTIENWESGKTKPADYILNMLERIVMEDEETEIYGFEHTGL